MALTRTKTEPNGSQYIFGWVIWMQAEDGTKVPVLVRDEALQVIASPPVSDINRLNEFRPRIEAIASAKHTAGQIESDGTVCVTAADVR